MRPGNLSPGLPFPDERRAGPAALNALLLGERRWKCSLIISLEDLLTSKNAVLILGAGASADYGFPLWRSLRSQLAEGLRNPDGGWEHGLDLTKADIGRMLKVLEDEGNTETSLDALVEANRNAHPQFERVFRRLVGLIVVRCEAEDASSGLRGWIDNLAQAIVGFVEAATSKREMLRECRTPAIVTFNYDRCFEYHFYKDLADRLEKVVGTSDWERYGRDFLDNKVIHPHGAIGSQPIPQELANVHAFAFANESTQMSVIYGNLELLQRSWGTNPAAPFVYSVDSFADEVRRESYEAAQQALGGPTLIIGMSPSGQSQQFLDLSGTAVLAVSNRRNEYEDPKDALGNSNVTCLGLRAHEIVSAMVRA
jgi:hypothetical protein